MATMKMKGINSHSKRPYIKLILLLNFITRCNFYDTKQVQ